MTKDEIDDVIKSWKTVNKRLAELSEDDVKLAMNREMVGNRRKDMVVRLHQRYTILRAARERQELIDSLAEVPAFLVGAV